MPFPLYDQYPPFNPRRNAVALFIGLLAGLFGGLLGLGGGVVTVPLLASLLGLGQHKAHGTSLAALVFTGVAGAAAYWRDGAVDVSAALFLALPAVFTAHSGAMFADKLSEYKLKRYFGFFILFVAAMLFIKPYLPNSPVSGAVYAKYAVLLAAGGATGFISGMMGVGGGSLMVPAMVLLAGMGQHVAQGSSLLAMVPAGISGAKTHWSLGNVASEVVPGLILGIVIGSFLGGMGAGLLPDYALRLMLGVVLVYYGLGYVMKSPGK